MSSDAGRAGSVRAGAISAPCASRKCIRASAVMTASREPSGSQTRRSGGASLPNGMIYCSSPSHSPRRSRQSNCRRSGARPSSRRRARPRSPRERAAERGRVGSAALGGGARGLRAPPLHRDADSVHVRQQQRERAERRDGGPPPRPFRQPLRARDGACANGFAREPAVEFVREFARAGEAAGGFFFEAAQAERLQIAVHGEGTGRDGRD